MRVYRPESTRPIPPGAKVDGKAWTVIYQGRNGERVRAVLTAGGRMRVSQGFWHIAFRDAEDRQRDIAAFKDEGDSRLLASKIRQLIGYHGDPLPPGLQGYCDGLIPRIAEALRDCGLLPRQLAAISAPLDELVTAYESALVARGRNDKYVSQTITMIREMFTICEFEFWRDIDRDKVTGFLRDLREGPRHLSYCRSNAFADAAGGFCGWVTNDRAWATESPLRGLKRLDARQDRRHPRRAISMIEFKRLLHAAENAPPRFNLTGHERRVLYEFCFETGLRAGEIVRLRAADFDLDCHRVIIRACKATKNKVDRLQTLSEGLCGDLAGLLANKLPDASVFKVSNRSTSLMIRADLRDAGLAYKDAAGACFDFHSLRGETASALIATGTDVKTTQHVLRHATAAMTMDAYARVMDQSSTGRAIAGLRELYADKPEQEINQVAVRTGTDDAPGEIYDELSVRDESHRTTLISIGQGNPNSEPKTALAMQDEGSQRKDILLVNEVHPAPPCILQPASADASILMTSLRAHPRAQALPVRRFHGLVLYVWRPRENKPSG